MLNITKKVVINTIDLKKLREKVGLSLRQLADLSGVDFTYINKAENGFITMPESTWNKIKKVLDKR